MDAVFIALVVVVSVVFALKAGDIIWKVMKAAFMVAITLAVAVFLFLGIASTQERVYIDEYGSTCTETYGLMIYTDCERQ
jgi:hypothetical protein